MVARAHARGAVVADSKQVHEPPSPPPPSERASTAGRAMELSAFDCRIYTTCMGVQSDGRG